MGNYEEQYRNYYSDAKSKLKIKTEAKESNNFNYEFREDEGLYKNKKYEEGDYIVNQYEGNNYLIEDYDVNNYEFKKENEKSRDIEKSAYVISESLCGTYRGLESYSGINNNNSTNIYRRYEGSNGTSYYGQGAGNNINASRPVDNLVGIWINRFIIKLALTVGLFICILGLKYSPYEETKAIYTSFKVAVDKDFKYEEFIESVKTIDVMKEINELKENFKMKSEDLNELNFKSDNKSVDSNF